MKKHPRRAAALAALLVMLSTTIAPLEGAASPGGIKIPDDPKYLFGEPDIPTQGALKRMDPQLSWYWAIQAITFARLGISPQVYAGAKCRKLRATNE